MQRSRAIESPANRYRGVTDSAQVVNLPYADAYSSLLPSAGQEMSSWVSTGPSLASACPLAISADNRQPCVEKPHHTTSSYYINQLPLPGLCSAAGRRKSSKQRHNEWPALSTSPLISAYSKWLRSVRKQPHGCSKSWSKDTTTITVVSSSSSSSRSSLLLLLLIIMSR